MRYTFLLLISFISLCARDNPFFPTDPNDIAQTTSNRIEVLQPFTTQNISLPNSARAIKAITITYQNLDGSISNETLDLNNKIDWHEPIIISQNKLDAPLSKVRKTSKTVDGKFIKFIPNSKTMRVVTKDKLLRNFMLTSPHRIVMDFSRDTSFKPKNFTINEAPFKKIRMGNHDKYYRVVIELDGQYKYKLQVSEEELNIVCY
jgi:hypothetical protein